MKERKEGSWSIRVGSQRRKRNEAKGAVCPKCGRVVETLLCYVNTITRYKFRLDKKSGFNRARYDEPYIVDMLDEKERDKAYRCEYCSNVLFKGEGSEQKAFQFLRAGRERAEKMRMKQDG